MSHDTPSTATPDQRSAAAWTFVRALADRSAALTTAGRRSACMATADGTLVDVSADDPHADAVWLPAVGWTLGPATGPDAERRALFELYQPVCSATAERPITIGHLGQSLDGCIATHSGDSRWVTGDENLRHMHRLRALSDAVIVGAATVAADDPQLTTRLVSGPSPVRVVIDSWARLSDHYRVFQDREAPTLYVYVAPDAGAVSAPGHAEALAIGRGPHGPDLRQLIQVLRARGCARIFVEGGGVTVSAFLAAGLLDRVHVTVAPLFIGGGRPAFRLPAANLIADCARPDYRVFRMGGDMLFDCDLRGTVVGSDRGIDAVARVL